MSAPGEVSGKLLDWDTEFFGRKIARAVGDRLSPDQFAAVDRWCTQSGIECLYFLARADDPLTVRTAERGGFGLMDIRVTLSRSGAAPTEASARQSPAAEIREVRPEDVGTLEKIAKEAHRNTRFFADANFPSERAEALYMRWIRQECEGGAQKVLVAVLPKDRAIGYVTCHLEASGGQGQIGLIAVDREAAGRGVGSCLILAALEWFASAGVAEIRVVTQGNNLAALRLYERHGFVARELQLWYHKWYPTAERRHA